MLRIEKQVESVFGLRGTKQRREKAGFHRRLSDKDKIEVFLFGLSWTKDGGWC
ncbi:MAG: hypothetical protein FWD39_02530 [Clostridiales bacterium]|nr:hypothetical protein [Clostridiales bacterium]